MKFALIAAICTLFFAKPSAEVDSCRSIYFSEPSEEQALLLQKTASEIKGNEALKLAYLGSAEAMLAEYGYNPFSKFKMFKRGTEQIEKAVLLAPENPEIRFLRLGVQTNAPSFLGYNTNQNEDVGMILKGLANGAFQNESSYRTKVINYIANKAPLSEQQQEQISALR